MGLLVKLLGLVDLAAAAALFLASSDLLPKRILLMIAAMLAIKGFSFKGDPVSTFDVVLAIYLLITLAINIKALSILFGIYLVFKGLFSLF